MRQLMVDFFRNQNFAGADDPHVRAAAMRELDQQDAVAGVDVVGQLEAMGLMRRQPGGAGMAHAGGGIDAQHLAGLNPQLIQQLQQANAIKALQAAIVAQSNEEKQAQLAKARFLPTKRLGVNSSQGTNIDANGAVNAGATSSIQIVTQVEGRITGFQVAPSCAPFFDIIDVKVAMVSLLAGALGEPAENYLPGSEMSPLEVERAPAGTPIIVIVQNRDGVARLFRGGFGFIKLTPPGVGMY